MKKIIILWLFFLAVFLFVSGKGQFRWVTTARNYFSLQAYSLMQGHLDLILYPKSLYDLSVYSDKVYNYWPPLPTLFVLPFILLFGTRVSDIFYTAFWASFGPVLIYLLLRQARKSDLIPQISDNQIYLLTLFFTFGTVYFYLAILGTVWFTSQIISVILLLSSLIMLFRFVEKKTPMLYIASLFLLSLAFWTRSTLILSLPLYLLILFHQKDDKKKKLFLISFTIIIINLVILGIYNYLRFDNFFENGLGLQKYNTRWREDVVNRGLISISYFPHNAFYMFVKPLSFEEKFPFVKPDPEGNSIFSTSPLLLLLFGIFSPEIWKKKKSILFPLIITSITIAFPILLYYGTGWFQFGYRYVLDFLPLLILILAYTLKLFPDSLVNILFIVSILMNSLGTTWMMQFYR